MTTMTCRVCDVIVPAADFCGHCGATAAPRRGDRLRLSAYAAAGGHVLRPSVTSTVFPALPRRSRPAFTVALIGVVALMLGAAVPRWEAALIGLVGVGLPLLFLAYLWEVDAGADLRLGTLTATAAIGIACGIGWNLATDVAAARVDDDALGLPVTPLRLLLTCLAIPLGFLILLLAPLLVLRVWRRGVREALVGFDIGALGALCFVSAWTLTALAPQFASGPSDDDGPSPAHLVQEALVQGVAVPLTAAAVGGAIGATLWFRPRVDAVHPTPWYSPASPAPALVFGLLAYAGLGLLDFYSPSNDVQTAVYAGVAVLALYVLRVVVHSTVLLEQPDEQSTEDPVLCPQCEHVVPDLAFCPCCGVAGTAASRASRARRRSARPVPVGS